jgi:hypothetical protein
MVSPGTTTPKITAKSHERARHVVLAAHGGGRIIPVVPASAGPRIPMLTYGFVAVTGDAVDIARITAFSFGVGVALPATGIAIAIAILGRELGTASSRAILERLRARLGDAACASEAR